MQRKNNDDKHTSFKFILPLLFPQVIRDAAQKKKHHTVHPEPIDGHFDLVENLFVPSTQVGIYSTNLLFH